MADHSLFVALKKKLQGDIAVHKTNIDVYMNNTVGIGEHIGGYTELKQYMEKTYWSNGRPKQKKPLPPTLDDIGANSE